ncbi:MAG TPA: nucleotide exchange factor GrpE [Sphingobium sp.]
MTDAENSNIKAEDSLPEDIANTDGASEDAAARRIGALEEQLATAKQDTLYAHAETQNVRRRLEKELTDARAYAATSFAREILSVADNVERALTAIPADLREDDKFKGLVVGLDATAKDLENVLRKNGIERFASIGESLDPNKHQAMIEIPHAEAAPGTIVQELQSGYMIKDRLLRPALVGVAKSPE